MAIPKVDAEALKRALEEFDGSLRDSPEWTDWEENKAQAWALVHNGKRYPPKKIISLASGAPVSSFSGGPESNSYLSERGFAVSRLREPTLKETLRLILERYGHARRALPFAGHHEIRELFLQAKRLLENTPAVQSRSHLSVVASYGKGNWATIPWISVLDNRETRTTQSGTYVVYLFREDGRGCYLKLAQGVTAAEKEFGAKAAEVLGERAKELRTRYADLGSKGFDLSGTTDLATTQRLGVLYEVSTVASKYYPIEAMPPDEELFEDLEILLATYEDFVDGRGRVAPLPDPLPIQPLDTAVDTVEESRHIEESEIEPQSLAAPEALTLEWLESRTGLPQDLLRDLVDSIRGPTPQIILAGPPGTSKTWVARQLALFLSGNRPDHVRLVQFHQGYSYEAFMEGLRPVAKGNAVGFELKSGVVLDVVDRMRRMDALDVKDQDHIIIIDEANRANLPRVLGELMFLFEYRGEVAHLQYSGPFSLPRNLRFLATMNTADRSIRSIDVALRRRFDVFELGPDPSILERFHRRYGELLVPDLIDGFLALNEALRTALDRHHTIGHAFFMRPGLTATSLQAIWNRKVFPLIEEFFFDQPELAAEFACERFWPSVVNR